jgi:ribose 5-phosphate isomerase A
MTDPWLEAKRAAGRAAAELARSDMTIGLGTGSTVVHTLDRLGERIRTGLRIRGVSTSEATAARAREAGIPLCDLADVEQLDLTIDGADEIDPQKRMIKGGGGALLREKIVAAAAREMVVLVSENKLVDRLGRFPLPVELLTFGWKQTLRALERAGVAPALRRNRDGGHYLSDNGNLIADCALGVIDDPPGLEQRLKAIPGVAEVGLFLGMAGRVYVGRSDGSVRVLA